MGAKMLESQLATLEDPNGEDGVVAVDISGTREAVGEGALADVKKLIEREIEEGE